MYICIFFFVFFHILSFRYFTNFSHDCFTTDESHYSTHTNHPNKLASDLASAPTTTTLQSPCCKRQPMSGKCLSGQQQLILTRRLTPSLALPCGTPFTNKVYRDLTLICSLSFTQTRKSK